HSGAALANYITNFARGLALIGSIFRATDSLTELRNNSDQLEDLADWYRSAVLRYRIATRVYAEGHSVKNVVTVVPISTANPGIARVKPIKLAFDHWEICKPRDRTYQVYAGTLKFLRQLIQREQESIVRRSKRRHEKTPVTGPKLELKLVDPNAAL